MTIARHYVMTAKADTADALRDALVALAAAVRPLDGCEGIAMFQDVAAPTRFVFVEYWASIEAHKTAGATLPKESFAPVMAALASPPEGTYLEQIAL